MLAIIKNRPPLVVIFLCILTAAFTLTYFAFYISSSDLILDDDVIYNWNQVLKHFNNLESCIENETMSDVKKNEAVNIKTVNTMIKISIPEVEGYSLVEGNLILEGWHPVCDKNGPPPNDFNIAFNVPSINLTEIEVCASIRGPAEFLPKFLEQNCNVTPTHGNKLKGRLSTSKNRHKEFCKSGSITKLLFLPEDRNNFGNYLNNEIKDTIYIHLLWSIYILFGILLIVFIYVFLESNQHIAYIEKCSNLIQRQ